MKFFSLWPTKIFSKRFATSSSSKRQDKMAPPLLASQNQGISLLGLAFKAIFGRLLGVLLKSWFFLLYLWHLWKKSGRPLDFLFMKISCFSSLVCFWEEIRHLLELWVLGWLLPQVLHERRTCSLGRGDQGHWVEIWHHLGRGDWMEMWSPLVAGSWEYGAQRGVAPNWTLTKTWTRTESTWLNKIKSKIYILRIELIRSTLITTLQTPRLLVTGGFSTFRGSKWNSATCFSFLLLHHIVNQ